MTKDQLAEQLNRLDPGRRLRVEEDELAKIFGEDILSYDSQEALKAISAFALEHRCTFSFHPREGAPPTFQKDDVF